MIPKFCDSTLSFEFQCLIIIQSHLIMNIHTLGASSFSVLPMDTYEPEEMGIKPSTLWLVDDMLYLLNYRHLTS